MSYIYSLQKNFPNELNLDQLTTLIGSSNIQQFLSCINIIDDNVEIMFNSTLDSDDLNTLNTLISQYVYAENAKINLITTGTYGTNVDVTIAPTSNRILVLPNISENLSKSHNTIVDVNGGGDYISISDAFKDGKISIFVRSGIYVETNDIIIPDRGKIEGEANGKVIIVFLGPYSMKIDGSNGNKEISGLINITKDSNDITGVETKFTKISIGDFIMIGNSYYTINNIIDDTHLTILEKYCGRTMTEQTYMAQSMISGVNINNIIISSSTTIGLFIRAVRYMTIKDIAVDGCYENIKIMDSGDSCIDTMIIANGKNVGISIDNCLDILCNSLNIFNNIGCGIKIHGNCNCIILNACSCTCNGNSGFYVDDTSNCINFTDCIAKQNASKGFEMTTNTDNIIIENSISQHNDGTGMYLDGSHNIISDCVIEYNNGNGLNPGNHGIVQGCQLRGNMNNGIFLDFRHDTVICNNRCSENGENGIYNNGDNNILSVNRCMSNTECGIKISKTSSNNIITSNNLSGNIENNFNDLGIGTINSNNII